MPLGMKVGLSPGHIVLNGDPAPPPPKRGTAPNFRPMSIVAKRSPVSATAEADGPNFTAVHRQILVCDMR